MNPSFEVEWGDSDNPPRFTFGEALEMLGVQPENVVVFRQLIKSARTARTKQERYQAIRKAYGELHFHDNEPDPYAWIATQGLSLRTEEVF